MNYLHFCPYGSYETTCGKSENYVQTTDRRAETTCPDCLSLFTG